MKKRDSLILAVLILFAACFFAACGNKDTTQKDGYREADSESDMEQHALTVGFAQVGEESDWRRANSRSIQETFTSSKGYHLLFDDAQNDQENQITAIRNFIQQGADYIVLEPIITTGWDTVLEEAKEEGIPVIVADRQISVRSSDLYAAWVGSDNLLEGRKVCDWLRQFAENHGLSGEDLKIVNIQGTIGSSPQIDREKALMEAAGENSWKILGQEKGDFTQAEGRESMQKLLQEHPDLNIVYCDNDNEAFGAIEAIENAGRVCGTDIQNGEIMILSFDATKKGLENIMDGKIACIAECNPLHGPRIQKIIESLEKGEEVAKEQFVEEQIFAGDDSIPAVSVNGTEYPVKIVTKELLDYRVY